MTDSSRPHTCPRSDCGAPIDDWFGEAATCRQGHSIMLRDFPVDTPPPAAVHPPAAGGYPNAGAAAEAAPGPRTRRPQAVSRNAASITPSTVRWIWPGRIPAGKITVIDGDPDKGKSFLTLAIAALFSQGRPMPGEDQPCCPAGDVLLLSNEDDPEDTIVPRLVTLGADRSRIHFLEFVRDPLTDMVAPITFPSHAAALADEIDRRKARIVFIDPVMAFFDGSVNTHRDQSIRHALNPLKLIAQQSGCAIVLVRHLNKSPGAAAIYRGGGSIGLIGAARSGLAVAADPVDPNRRLLMSIKSNLSARPDTLIYSIEGNPPTVIWHGRADVTADTVLGALIPAGEPAHDIDRAIEWLRDALAGGPRDARDIYRQGQGEGFGDQTIKRARARLGAAVSKEGFGKDGRWVWHPPVESSGPHQSPAS